MGLWREKRQARRKQREESASKREIAARQRRCWRTWPFGHVWHEYDKWSRECGVCGIVRWWI